MCVWGRQEDDDDSPEARKTGSRDSLLRRSFRRRCALARTASGAEPELRATEEEEASCCCVPERARARHSERIGTACGIALNGQPDEELSARGTDAERRL